MGFRRPSLRFNRGRSIFRRPPNAGGPPPPDLINPVLSTATIPAAGTSIALVYNETLDPASVPAAGAYSLAGTAITVSSVGVSGSTVTLTLSGAIIQGAVVTLNYTAGGAPVQDLAGNDAANLVAQAVTNSSTVDGTAPTLSSAVVPSAGTTLVLTYNEALNTGSVPLAAAFSITMSTGLTRTVSSVGVSGSAVTLTLSGAINTGATVTVSYTAGAAPIEDVAGNNAANLVSQAVTNNSTADALTPTLSSAVVPSAGTTLVLTYSEALDTGSVPLAAAYSVTMSTGITRTVSSVGVSGSAVTLTMSGAINTGATVTVSYTAGAAPVRDAAGNNAANLVSQAVTNNSTADADLPGVSAIASGSVGTYVEITVDEPCNTGVTPAAGAFVFSLATITPGAPAWQSMTVLRIPLVGFLLSGESTTLSYTAGGAPIQDSAGNALPNFSGSAVTNNSTRGLALQVSRTTSSDTWTPARSGTSTHQCTAAGAGGTTNTRGGGGGAFSVIAFTHNGGVGYARSAGAGSTAGASPAAGGNATFNSTSCVAEGGGGSGTRSDGGRASAGTGDTKYDGGAAGTAGGTQPGGGSAGSGGAASGSTPGTLTGAPGSASTRTHRPGAGGRCVLAGGENGADGRVRSFWSEASSLTVAEIAGVGEYRSTADGTNHNITLPPGAVAGDVVQAFIGWNGSSTVSSFTGWTLKSGSVSGTAVSGAHYERTLTGTDPVAIVLSGSEALQAYTVGEKNSAGSSSTATNGSSTSADPPSHNAGSSALRRWYAFTAVVGTSAISGSPANYDGLGVMPTRVDSNQGVGIALLWRELTATSEDPAAYTVAGTGAWVTITASTTRI